MLTKLKELVGNIFHTDEKEKEAEQQKNAVLQKKVNNALATNSATNTYNPFLKQNGELFNPQLNYQGLLNNSKISQIAKQYITEATGLSPTVTTETVAPNNVSSSSRLRTTATPTNTINLNLNGNKTNNNLVESAKKFIGTPYVWGGESVDEGGMDCSGFVYNALKDAGYDVGRTTAQGYRSYGDKVEQSNMQPGDLVFFGKNGKATHIGIYIGNGQMVHSSGGSGNTKANPGKGVSIANVNSRKDLLEVRRYA